MSHLSDSYALPLLEPAPKQLMLEPERSRWKRYSVAILLVLLALVSMLLLDRWIPMYRSPFLVFLAAVMVSAWYGGFGAGLCAMAIATVAVTYFFLPPTYVMALQSADLARLGRVIN